MCAPTAFPSTRKTTVTETIRTRRPAPLTRTPAAPPPTRKTTVADATRTARRTVHSTAILAIVLVSYFMIILDNSIIFTGLPRIQHELGFSPLGLSWATNAYTLVFGGFLLLGARSGDVLGRKRMFILGLGIFAVASLLISVAPSEAFMIGARALQGFGGALVAPLSLSLLTANFPEGHARMRAVSYYGATAGIGAAAGMIIGGALAQWVSWRAGFFINVPIGIVMILATIKYVPETLRQRGRFDLPGSILSTAGVGAIVLGIINSADFGWSSPLTCVPLTVGAVGVAALARNEARAAQPIMPLGIFASRQRAGAYLGRFLFGAFMMSYFYFTTQYLQGVYHFTAFQAGLAFLPMTLASFAIALAVPRLTRRVAPSVVLTAGFVLLTVGLGWLSLVTPTTPYLVGIGLPLLVYGIGQGLTLGPLTGFGVAGATQHLAGPASGMINAAQQLGGTVGIAALVALTSSTSNDLAEQATTALAAGAILAAAGLIVALTLIIPGERAARARPTHKCVRATAPAKS